jgi:RNA polymerase primary sigma factor
MRQLKIIKQITNRESESLDRYLNEIGRLDLITAEMEVELAKKIREGDPVALEKLTKANLRFVVSVAKQYQNKGLSLNDLINEGNLGLIKAGQKFDEQRGFKFISYAVWWIRQSILQALAEQSRIVRLPLNRVGSLNKISRTFSELEQKYQREPSNEELAKALDMTEENMFENMTVGGRQISFDAPFQMGEEGTLLDITADCENLPPDHELMMTSLRTQIDLALGSLHKREAEVLTLFYGLNGTVSMSLEEIGQRFDLTRERVRQIKEKATLHLRRSFRSNRLNTFLG